VCVATGGGVGSRSRFPNPARITACPPPAPRAGPPPTVIISVYIHTCTRIRARRGQRALTVRARAPRSLVRERRAPKNRRRRCVIHAWSSRSRCISEMHAARAAACSSGTRVGSTRARAVRPFSAVARRKRSSLAALYVLSSALHVLRSRTATSLLSPALYSLFARHPLQHEPFRRNSTHALNPPPPWFNSFYSFARTHDSVCHSISHPLRASLYIVCVYARIFVLLME